MVYVRYSQPIHLKYISIIALIDLKMSKYFIHIELSRFFALLVMTFAWSLTVRLKPSEVEYFYDKIQVNVQKQKEKDWNEASCV